MNVMQLNTFITCDRVHKRNNYYKEQVHIMHLSEIERRGDLMIILSLPSEGFRKEENKK